MSTEIKIIIESRASPWEFWKKFSPCEWTDDAAALARVRALQLRFSNTAREFRAVRLTIRREVIRPGNGLQTPEIA